MVVVTGPFEAEKTSFGSGGWGSHIVKGCLDKMNFGENLDQKERRDTSVHIINRLLVSLYERLNQHTVRNS